MKYRTIDVYPMATRGLVLQIHFQICSFSTAALHIKVKPKCIEVNELELHEKRFY